MSKEEKDYTKYALSPNKDVMVPFNVYIALTDIIQEVKKKHSKVIRTDKFSWYNKVTHKKLTEKVKSKMPLDKLQKEYYENIDFEATNKTVHVDRDELGSAAIQLLAEFRGVFRHNVDKDNAVLRPEPIVNQVNPTLEEVAEEKPVAGPTLVKDES